MLKNSVLSSNQELGQIVETMDYLCQVPGLFPIGGTLLYVARLLH